MCGGAAPPHGGAVINIDAARRGVSPFSLACAAEPRPYRAAAEYGGAVINIDARKCGQRPHLRASIRIRELVWTTVPVLLF